MQSDAQHDQVQVVSCSLGPCRSTVKAVGVGFRQHKNSDNVTLKDTTTLLVTCVILVPVNSFSNITGVRAIHGNSRALLFGFANLKEQYSTSIQTLKQI